MGCVAEEGHKIADFFVEAKVVYASKDGKSSKVFPSLEWLAAMCSHMPIP